MSFAPLKRYESLGDHTRDESHFLSMYLGDYRPVEYLATRATGIWATFSPREGRAARRRTA